MNEHTRIQRKKDADHDAVPQLAQDTHAFMEPQFGFDLGQVQIQHSAPTLTLQPKLTVSQPGDPYEQEADRVADAVVNGGYAFVDSPSTTPSVQRDAADSPPPQSSGQLPPDAEFPPSDSGPSASEEMAEGLEAIGKAIQKTPAGKELKRKAEELGAELWSHLEGKVVVIVSGAAALGTLFAANRELPAAIPDIPLDWAVPGLKANLTYEGPLRKPTKVMLSLTLSFGGGGSDTGATSRQTSDPQAEEIRRFQQSIHYTPGTPEAREEAARQAADQQRAVSRALNPDLGDFARLGSPSAFGWHSENAEASQPNPFQLTPPTFGEDLGRPRLPRLVPELRLDEPFIMRKASGSTEAMAAPSVVQEVLQSGGQPLDDTTRAFMEPRFGRDFGHVRIHTDSTAARSAEAVSAHAYTVGSDVVFGAGQYRPGTDNGKRLIAHELTHVMQQSSSPSSALIQRAWIGIRQLGHSTKYLGKPWSLLSGGNPYQLGVYHAHLWFEDKKEPGDVGFGEEGLFHEPNRVGEYTVRESGFDDKRMRSAVSMNLYPGEYNLILNNCQDWMKRVTDTYRVASVGYDIATQGGGRVYYVDAYGKIRLILTRDIYLGDRLMRRAFMNWINDDMADSFVTATKERFGAITTISPSDITGHIPDPVTGK